MVWNPDGGDTGKVPNKPSWAGGWLDFSSNPDNTNKLFLSSYSPPQSYGGLLGPYLSGISAFRCPEDHSTATFFAREFQRVRSVVMNGYMNGRRADGSVNAFTKAPFANFQTLSDIRTVQPSKLFVFIDAREDSINDPVFKMDLTKNLDASNNVTPGTSWIVDYPADWHEGGTTLSFVDGHVEYWRWIDTRTTPSHNRGQFLQLNFSSPNNADMGRLSKATSYR